MDTLDYTLNRLGEEVSRKFRMINHGGCCVYAALVAAELIGKGLQAKGIVASYKAIRQDTDIDAVRPLVPCNTIYAWQDKKVDFAHVGLEFVDDGETKHYDTNGVKLADGYLDSMPIYDGRLDLTELKELANDDNWNPSFKRGNIPQLRNMVKLYLKDLNISTKEPELPLVHYQFI